MYTPSTTHDKVHQVENGLRRARSGANGHPTGLRLADRMAHHRVPGASIAVVDRAALDWARGYGVLAAGAAEPVRPDSLFHACSMSKFVTALAALRLVARGVLDLDEDVNRTLKGWQVPENALTRAHPVTLRRLLTHQSGIVDPEGSFDPLRAGEEMPAAVDVLAGRTRFHPGPVEVTVEAGCDFNYSDAGFCVVEQLLVDATGKRFEALVQELVFGPEYIIPKPFDSRLILRIAPAVAKAAAESGVATRPIEDLKAYRESLGRFVTHTGLFMRPVFAAAKAAPRRVAYAEGEDERVLRAVQAIVDDGLARPTLIGRPAVIAQRIERAGLRMKAERDFDLVNPEDDPRYRQYWEAYHRLLAREGVTPDVAKAVMRRSNTAIGAMMVKLGDADAMLCGLVGRYDAHLEHVEAIVGRRADAPCLAAMNALMLDKHTLFIADTFVNEDPSAEQLAGIAKMAAEEVRRFGLPPKVAFLSHSLFGSSRRPSARKMREACERFRELAPDIEADGEMHGDAALNEEIRGRFLMDSRLTGTANVLILPNLDAANILFNVLKVTGGQGVTVGPVLLGANAPVHILTPSSTMRRVVNMTALAVADAAAGASRAG